MRDHLACDLPRTLERLADIGFTHVEPFAFLDDAKAYAELLRRLALTAPTAHIGLIDADLPAVFRAAERIGVGTVIDPMIDPARWITREGVEAIADDLNDIARKAADHGLRIGYHNHAFELSTRIDGVAALEVFADALSDAVVLEIDTYWAEVGGENAARLIRRLGEKVAALHIKDGPKTADSSEQVAVGAGDMPIVEILEAAPAEALVVVELDAFIGDVFDAVADSYAYLTGHNN